MASPTSVDELDGITLIINDHRNAEAFFRMYEQTSEPEPKLRLVAKMIEELTMHAAIEEQVLYPLIGERLEGGEELREHALQEHQEAREVLAELERMAVSDDRFDDKVAELISEVRHHVDDEERDLLPKLAESASKKDLASLAQQLRQAKASAPVSPSQSQGPTRRSGGTSGGDDVAQATTDELYRRAQELDIQGRSKMSKDELAKEISKRS